MGVDFKGVEEDVNNSVVPGYVVQGSDTYSSTVRKRKLGGDGGDVEYPGGVSPPAGQADFGDDG